MTPWTYCRAGYELIAGQWQGSYLAQTTGRVWDWLRQIPDLRPFSRAAAVAFTILRLPALALTVFAAFKPKKTGPVPFVLAWTALAAHLPTLFIFEAQFRYAMLGWDLCIILFLAVMANLYPEGPRRLVSCFKKTEPLDVLKR
jgi:hypothetical protein